MASETIDDDLVSVIIPTYNRADLISESIESSLNQTYRNVEVIVVDDGSKDKTQEVCTKYRDRIEYYYKQNGGIGSALNYGIKKMNGKWFKWLSSDDVLTLDAVEVLLKYAHESEAMIVYADYDIIDNDSKFVKKFLEPHFDSYYEYASALWTRFIGNGSSILIHKSCFDKVGLFDETLHSAEDYDWWLRACLIHRYRFFHLPKVVLKYRIHNKQLTAEVIHNALPTAEKIRNKTKEEIIFSAPEWWNTLAYYQKLYAKHNQRGGMARRMLRRSLLRMPQGMRKVAISAWQKSLKPIVDSDE